MHFFYRAAINLNKLNIKPGPFRALKLFIAKCYNFSREFLLMFIGFVTFK